MPNRQYFKKSFANLKCYVLTLCLLGSLKANAQEKDFHQSFSFGLKSGFNVANVTFTPESNSPTDNRIGLIAGGIVDIPLATNIFINAELLYIQAGYKFSDPRWVIKSDYVGIPVIFEYKFTSKYNRFAGLVSCGAMPAFNANSEVVVGSSIYNNSSNTSVFDFSLLVGLGAEIEINSFFALRYDARYAYSITDAYVPENTKIYGRNILVTFGVDFVP